MEFLVEFEVRVPADAPESEVVEREKAEAAAAAELAETGNLVRLWKLPDLSGRSRAVGLYRAREQRQLDRMLRDLPLYEWLKVTVTPLDPHPNDPGSI